MFLITHRASGAVAALLIAAFGALSLGHTPATDCAAAPAERLASTALERRPPPAAPLGRGSP